MNTATQKTQAKLPVFYTTFSPVCLEEGWPTHFGDNIGTRLPNKGANFPNPEFQAQGRRESTVGREPR